MLLVCVPTSKISFHYIDVIHFLVLDHDADIFMLIFDAMKMFFDKEEIQIYGCQALYLLLVKGMLCFSYIFIQTISMCLAPTELMFFLSTPKNP